MAKHDDVELMAIAYANPGFFFTFSSAEEFEKGVKKGLKKGYEEYELDFSDGSREDAQLFRALRDDGMVNQTNLEAYFEEVVPLREDDKAALFWIASNGISRDLDDALREVDRTYRAFHGRVEEYAEELVDDIGIENLNNPDFYFDYEAFGRDLRISGDLHDDDVEEGDEWWADLDDEEIGQTFVDDHMGGLSELSKETIRNYFDMEKFARDLDMSGDVSSFAFGGSDWVMTNPNG
jgi:antirestriction protein